MGGGNEAERKHDLKSADIEHRKEAFLAAGENGLKNRPNEELKRKDAEIKKFTVSWSWISRRCRIKPTLRMELGR